MLINFSYENEKKYINNDNSKLKETEIKTILKILFFENDIIKVIDIKENDNIKKDVKSNKLLPSTTKREIKMNNNKIDTKINVKIEIT